MSRRTRRGGALVMALSVFMMVALLGASLLSLTAQAARRGRLDTLRTRALAVAEAGVEKAVYYLRTTAPDGTIDGSWRTSGWTEAVDGQGEYTFTIEGTSEDETKVVITSYARVGDLRSTSPSAFALPGEAGPRVLFASASDSGAATAMRRALRVAATVENDDVGIWNNVIFGGVGQNGRSVNGNIVIRGNMHLLGDGEPFTDVDGDQRWDAGETFTDVNGNGVYNLGEPFTDADADGRFDTREPFVDVNGNGRRDPPLTVTDLGSELSGTANIGNHYNGMSTTLRSLLPPIPTVSYRGEVVESLKAKLRVKNGRVDVSGTATVGSAQQTGGSPAVKETMNGVYVSDGFGGNQGATQVYSDNGTSRKYNLGDIARFPTLIEPTTIDGRSYDSHLDYLRAVGLNISGSITLRPGTPYGPVADGRGNLLAVDAFGNITVQGIVCVSGDIRFARNGGDRTMRYLGRGTLASTGSIFVSTDLLPAAPTFPINHALGLVARRRMELATGSGDSQLRLAGAFYAQEQIISAKQNEIAGSFVSSYFAMTNVPHMYQVPALPDYLPPGMPGAGHIWVKSIRMDSWKEIEPTAAAAQRT